jgi:hypothetical protein
LRGQLIQGCAKEDFAQGKELNVIPNTKINFRNGKRTEIAGGRKLDESGGEKEPRLWRQEESLTTGSRVLLI